jgi:hypothetical protein
LTNQGNFLWQLCISLLLFSLRQKGPILRAKNWARGWAGHQRNESNHSDPPAHTCLAFRRGIVKRKRRKTPGENYLGLLCHMKS